MTIETFTASLDQPRPPKDISRLLAALWHDAKSNWSAAHDIAQDIETPDGSWIHAYLHRKEGDSGNAAYWYRKAGRVMPDISLEAEWRQIATEFLKHTS